jgi:nicotinate phosphoribosyltransferase
MGGLETDLYQLTMAAGYFQAGKVNEVATFELFVRRLPPTRNYLIAAGLQQAVDYLLNLSFKAEEIAYLRGLRQFSQAPAGFFDFLGRMRFTGDLDAVAEGTPVFEGEPLLRVRAPLIEAQIPETYLLATINFQTAVATKASRLVEAAGSRAVVEFGTRRAHSPAAGILAGRAAYIGGSTGTSNVEAGFRYGIPVFGTAAHSWVQSFTSELEAFRQLQQLLGENTVYLIDTYDTLEGARRAASLGRPLWGVRLDSGNLFELSRSVRQILDEAGLHEARIMATGDLNEYKILELVAAKVPIDAFGVGAELATSADAPALGGVYKLVELETEGEKRHTAKLSPEKYTMPGAKQVFRYERHDEIACDWEQPLPGGRPLLAPVIRNGRLVQQLPSAAEAREHSRRCLAELPKKYLSLFAIDEPYPVRYTAAQHALLTEIRRRLAGSRL